MILVTSSWHSQFMHVYIQFKQDVREEQYLPTSSPTPLIYTKHFFTYSIWRTLILVNAYIVCITSSQHQASSCTQTKANDEGAFTSDTSIDSIWNNRTSMTRAIQGITCQETSTMRLFFYSFSSSGQQQDLELEGTPASPTERLCAHTNGPIMTATP